MKHDDFSPNPAEIKQEKPAGLDVPPGVTRYSQNEADFTPLPDEVARRAYFTYENEGALEGQAVQHWLTAEAELIAERKLTRTHGFQNRT